MAKRCNRRRERYEDKRLDWRDPNMPVLVLCDVALQHPDGRIEHQGTKLMEITPEQRRLASEKFMKASVDPDWRNDPTYFAKKRRPIR